MFHKAFPFGKGMWIWKIPSCLNGDINAIITKCKTYDVSYVLVKSGDGENIWSQLTADVVKKFHDAGLKIYSWSYVYGDKPLQEAQVALHSLSLGVDGHVFDAEGEYERAINNAQAAETMLTTVRAKYPDVFLAHAPFPIIDYHKSFPYVTFGKYCDAVMPQIYFGTMQRSVKDAISATYTNFKKWQDTWSNEGHDDSVKPLIPISQAYDVMNATPPYILTPADILSFCSIMKAYKSINFWSFQHIVRDDCWEAIRAADVDKPTDDDLGIVHAAEQEQPPQHVTEAQKEPIQEVQQEVQQPQEQPQEVPAKEEISQQVPEAAQPEESAVTTEPLIIVQPPEVAVLPETSLKQCFNVPTDRTSTITIKPNDKHPNGFETKVVTHQTHQEIVAAFLLRLWQFIVTKLKRS